jgi:hypothetical protein
VLYTAYAPFLVSIYDPSRQIISVVIPALAIRPELMVSFLPRLREISVIKTRTPARLAPDDSRAVREGTFGLASHRFFASTPLRTIIHFRDVA